MQLPNPQYLYMGEKLNGSPPLAFSHSILTAAASDDVSGSQRRCRWIFVGKTNLNDVAWHMSDQTIFQFSRQCASAEPDINPLVGQARERVLAFRGFYADAHQIAGMDRTRIDRDSRGMARGDSPNLLIDGLVGHRKIRQDELDGII